MSDSSQEGRTVAEGVWFLAAAAGCRVADYGETVLRIPRHKGQRACVI